VVFFAREYRALFFLLGRKRRGGRAIGDDVSCAKVIVIIPLKRLIYDAHSP